MRKPEIFVRQLVLIATLGALSGLLVAPAYATVGAPASQPATRSMPGATLSAAYVQRKIVNDCDRLVARPRHIDWCGNTGDRFRSLTWSSWGVHEARARGSVRVNDCRPSCAEGTPHYYGVKLRLHRDVFVNGHPRFLRVTYTFLSGPHQGYTNTLPLPRKPYR